MFRKSKPAKEINVDLRMAFVMLNDIESLHQDMFYMPLFMGRHATGPNILLEENAKKDLVVTFLRETTCRSRGDFVENFKGLWTCIDFQNERFPEKMAAATYEFRLSGVIGKTKIDKTLTSLDAFHAFLSENKLIPADSLKSNLKVDYQYTFGSVEEYTTFNSIEIAASDFREKLANLKDVVNSSIVLKGRIGTEHVNQKFEDKNTLEKYLEEHLEEVREEKVKKFKK